ncbi:hypothetical protein B0O99DRAFT_742855 [Bisporella sp. PMI_857]|nr:hypothetical protein B0O99DRAFT_742855 [Bisporella sp. PMI_857]
MARTKQTARQTTKGVITWTRFYLPEEQEWPTWSIDYGNVYVSPLSEVQGCRGNVFLGRMVDRPEQAAYIIEWDTLEDVKAFQSSPACVEFLRNLPEYDNDNDNSQVSIDSGLALRHPILDYALSSSRFLALHHAFEGATPTIEGRVTFTALLVPRKVKEWTMWNDSLKYFQAPAQCGTDQSDVWFWVLMEDHSVEEKFGKLEQTQSQPQTQEENQARTIFCHFCLWKHTIGTPEDEEAFPADPQAWKEELPQVVPPVTAWEQERWDIREVP